MYYFNVCIVLDAFFLKFKKKNSLLKNLSVCFVDYNLTFLKI